MYKTQLLDYLPLWGSYLAMVAVFLVAAEGGYRFAGYRLHRKNVGQTSQASAIMGATLGLLAFMPALTFGMGASRFDTRKELVLDESNAVRTAHLRTDLHAKRVTAGLRNRIPVSIWVTLYFVASLAMAVMGYHARLAGRRSTMATVALMMTFSAVMLLIMDLDRPDQRLFAASQRAMAELLEKMNQAGP
jgi:hypothetical protein